MSKTWSSDRMVSLLGRLLLLVLIAGLLASAGVLWVSEYRVPAMLFACGAAALFWLRDSMALEQVKAEE